MSNDFVKGALINIMALERAGADDNAEEIERISLAAVQHIVRNDERVDPEVHKFLDDYDVRRKDVKYREFQTQKVKQLVDAGLGSEQTGPKVRT